MKLSEVLTTALDLDEGFVKMAFDGLSTDELAKTPDPKSNNMGWLLWHKMRTEDSIVAMLGESNQVFADGAWSAKIGPPDDPSITGRGVPAEEATAYRVKDVDALMEYCKAVRGRTKDYLSTIKEEDLNRELPYPAGGTRPATFYLAILLVDGLHHSGQVSYLRGHLRGPGWAPA